MIYFTYSYLDSWLWGAANGDGELLHQNQLTSTEQRSVRTKNTKFMSLLFFGAEIKGLLYALKLLIIPLSMYVRVLVGY